MPLRQEALSDHLVGADQQGPPHSKTSALEVLRSMTNSNFDGRSIGRYNLSPRKIRSAI